MAKLRSRMSPAEAFGLANPRFVASPNKSLNIWWTISPRSYARYLNKNSAVGSKMLSNLLNDAEHGSQAALRHVSAIMFNWSSRFAR